MDTVDTWHRLSAACAYYSDLGYAYRLMPWTAPLHTLMLTCPEETLIVNSDVGALVGSSEQSFLNADLESRLGVGRFLTITPCFRVEAHPDRYHQDYFMKAELYVNEPDIGAGTVLSVMHDAFTFFQQIVDIEDGAGVLESVLTDDGIDILYNGIELGSYGLREVGGQRWVYGTAIAEPRLSRALSSL